MSRNVHLFFLSLQTTVKRQVFSKVFLGKTYDVSPYDSQRSHPSINLGVKLDLCPVCINCCEMSGLHICLSQLYEGTLYH